MKWFGRCAVMLALVLASPLVLADSPPPRVIFVATVRLDEPNKADNAVLDPMVIMDGSRYLSPLDHRERVTPLLQPPARYDLKQAGVLKGTIKPVSMLSSEHCDNGLMTASGADLQSKNIFMSEPDYHIASFLVDSSPMAVDGLPLQAEPLAVSEAETQSILAMAKSSFKQQGLPETALARITVKETEKRQLGATGAPVILATIALPLPEYTDGQGSSESSKDSRYGSMFWVGRIDAQGRPETLWSAMSHDAQSEDAVAYYTFLDAADLNQDGTQEIFLQKVSYYSDAGISFVILGWDGKTWAVRYEGGGNSGC